MPSAYGDNPSAADLARDIDAKLEYYQVNAAELSLREKVQVIADFTRAIRDFAVGVVSEGGLTASSARERIRLYLVRYPMTVIHGAELEVVSGISEYGRRIRELRTEHGYQIATGASPDPDSGIDLRPNEYLLVDPEPDNDAARRWKLVHEIRRKDLGSRDRILEFFRENVGSIVTTEELSYVANGASEFGRRVRELRTEEGFAIATQFTGRPDLGPGQYVLESLDRVSEPHDRNIPSAIQKSVYSRDKDSCRSCGWNHGRRRPDDPRYLELHHLQEHVDGGLNTEENLIVICSRCHDEVHAGRLTLSGMEGRI